MLSVHAHIPPRRQISDAEFAALPRRRVRAISDVHYPSLENRPPVPYLDRPFRAERATEPGVVTARQVGRLFAEPILNTLPAAVRKGQCVATIVSLGTRHEIRAPFDGVVVEQLAASNEPVMYGQPVLRMAA